MWIRSQDGQLLLKCHSLSFSSDGSGCAFTANGQYHVGWYQTKKEATTILDEIHEHIVNNADRLVRYKIYSMPRGE